MMKKINNYYRLIGVAMAFTAFMAAGCSVLFLTMGNEIDKKNQYNRQQLQGWEFYRIPNGARLEIRTFTRKTYIGIFAGTERLDPQHDTIDNVVLLKSIYKKKNDPALKIDVEDIKTIRTTIKRERTFVPLDQLGSVEKGERLEIYQHGKYKPLRGYLIEVVVPRAAGRNKYISIKTGTRPNALFKSQKDVLLTDIDSVIIPVNKTNATLAYFLTGLSVDAIGAIFAVIAAVETSKSLSLYSNSTNSGGSCPYIYSFDGNTFRRDAEIFGGAIFPAAQRTDRDNLDYLKPDNNGVCRLTLTNELEETQYVDALQLVAVDHPVGSKVYPSFDGTLFFITAPQQPATAVAEDGSDIREQLLDKDGNFWLSSPFNRNPDNPADLRDGAVVEFRRPAGSKSAALVFNVRNTIWAAEMQREVLALPGTASDDWYRQLDTSATERKVLHDAIVREGMLLVNIWDGKNWRPAGYVWEVGSAVPKDIVLEVDLSDIPGETLRVRLDCPPGVWILDRMAADFSYATGTTGVQTFLPDKATDNTGRDITALLSHADHQFFQMPDTKTRAEIEYHVTTDVPKGFERTFLIGGSGYYTVHTRHDAPPQRVLLGQLLHTPGAYNRYALQKLNSSVQEILRKESQTINR